MSLTAGSVYRTAFPSFLLLCLASLLPAPVLAADAAAADSLAAARARQVAMFEIIGDFHMRTLLSGDPQRSELLRRHVEAQDKLDAALAASTGNARADAALATANAEWPTFRRLASSNTTTDKDTDVGENLITDLYASADKMDQALTTAIGELQKTGSKAAEVHAANVLLQRTAAHYLKRAADLAPGVGAADDFDISVNTRQLDDMLQAVARHLGDDKDAKATLQQVMMKWNFIKPSLINYNEKTVPFIVDRYAQKLAEDLTQLTEAATGK